MTLLELLQAPYIFDCRKHGLAPDPEAYAMREIDAMSNSELVRALSDALDEWKAQHLTAPAAPEAPRPATPQTDASPGLDM